MITRKKYEPEKETIFPTAAYLEKEKRTHNNRSYQQPGRWTGSGTYPARLGKGSASQPEEEVRQQKWLTGGPFEDGYQFGDLARGITGTMVDITDNVFEGAFRVAENTIDSAAGRLAGYGIWEQPLTEFVKQDLIDEKKWAQMYTRFGSLPGLAGTLFGIDTERDSFIGDKGDSVAQSAGQLALAKGFGKIKIPGEAITGLSAYGSEMESALLQGATAREAQLSAAITAAAEIGTEKISGAIKFGGTAVDDLLVDHLTEGISNKFLRTMAQMGLGAVGEGNEEIASEMISRFGQWLTYQDDKTVMEMLFSGEAREAYLDSFLGGAALGGPAGGLNTLLSEQGRGNTAQEKTVTAVDGPSSAALAKSLAEGGTLGVKTLSGPQTQDIGQAAAEAGIRGAESLAQIQDSLTEQEKKPMLQRESRMPEMIPVIRDGTPEGLWTETENRTAGDTAIDMDRVYGPDSNADTGTVGQQPMRYEDALKAYLQGDTRLSEKPDMQTGSPDAAAGTNPTAGPDIAPETAPKTKEQIISELAPKIRTGNMTSGRAIIAAQQTYADAERRFGSAAQAVLEQLQPGQEPRKFLDGIQNAYLAGKIGNINALKSSAAAAYLSEEQRQTAYKLGESIARTVGGVPSSGNTARTFPARDPVRNNEDLLSVLKNGTIEERKAVFKKAFDEGMISTRISPQKQARHIRGTKAFLNYDATMAQSGDHPSYLREDLSERDLHELVTNRLQGAVRIVGNHYYEYVYCDEVIGYYYSKPDGRYVPTMCAQVAYALGGKNMHIIPVRGK